MRLRSSKGEAYPGNGPNLVRRAGSSRRPRRSAGRSVEPRGLLPIAVALLLALPGSGEAWAQGFPNPLPTPPVLTGENITITMEEADIQVLPGPKTRMWTYGGTFPGPTIRRPSGQKTTVTFVNNLPASAGSMTVHHHGNHSAPSEDGQPEDLPESQLPLGLLAEGHDHHGGPSLMIESGGSRTYTYELMEDGAPERAAFQWYHDHRMDVTARNVWMGLAGMSILDDAFDQSLPLPRGEFDIPLMIVTRAFDANNQIPYTDGFGGFGTIILVNGTSRPHLQVGTRRYRFRILNAANRDVYELSLSNGRSMIQIATESGLLPAPVVRDRITLAPAERVEVIVDFAGLLGQNLTLRSGTGSSAKDILQFRVTRDLVDDSSVPETLRSLPEFEEPSRTRYWFFSSLPMIEPLEPIDLAKGLFDRNSNPHITHTINGLRFDPARVDACPRLNSTEKWTLINNASPVLGAAHVIHIHDVDWLMVNRNGMLPAAYEAGLKETFFLEPGEVVEVISKFTDHLGRYVIHCHMLEHEDDAMMATFEVVPEEGPLPPYCPPDVP